MCGIVGYIGAKDALPIVVAGLKKLEYRGYDSAGVALWDGTRMRFEKTAGRVLALESKIFNKPWVGGSAIAHTRWATHGKPSDRNAHPHTDCTENIFLVHNGIIENYSELKEALSREGHVFSSETDTEVLAHLVERHFLTGDNFLLEGALFDALKHVTGTFGVAAMSKNDPSKIVVARRGSPIILGVGENEYLVASDASAIVEYTKNVVYLRDNELAVLTPKDLKVFNLSSGKPWQSAQALTKQVDKIDWDVEASQKGGYKHFMKKEIFEGPASLENVLRGRIAEGSSVKLGGLLGLDEKLKNVKRIVITACGTSYYSGLVGKYYFEELAKIPTSVEYASEFRYGNSPVGEEDAVILISQSGETADTLEALREAKKKGALTLGVVNVVGSTIARESDFGVFNHAGPEIGVASTKAFISQLGALLLIAIYVSRLRKSAPEAYLEKIIRELKQIPSKMEKILKKDGEIKALSKKYLQYRNFLFLGRKYNFPVALEGALKLKEISYRHAEGYAAGEMKHGPIALIDDKFPVVALAPKDTVYDKVISNILELKARNAKVLAVATEEDVSMERVADDVIFIPPTMEILSSMLTVVPLQLFAYHTADLLDLDVDKPRNLAKSVTVE